MSGLCQECSEQYRKWLDYRAPDHFHRWKGQCCISRADDAGNGACPRCREALKMHREERLRFIREQLQAVTRQCKNKHTTPDEGAFSCPKEAR